MNATAERATRTILTTSIFLASFAPTLAVAAAAARGDVGIWFQADLLIASAIIAAGHALALWLRLRRPSARATRRRIAAVYDIALTAIGTTAAAGGFPYRYAALATETTQHAPTVALWMLLQLTGIGLGELGWSVSNRLLPHTDAEHPHPFQNPSAANRR